MPTTCDKCQKEIEQQLLRITLPSGTVANLCKECAYDVEVYIFGVEVL